MSHGLIDQFSFQATDEAMQLFVHFLRGSSHFDQRLRQVEGFVRQAPGATHAADLVLGLGDDLRVPPAADLVAQRKPQRKPWRSNGKVYLYRRYLKILGYDGKRIGKADGNLELR